MKALQKELHRVVKAVGLFKSAQARIRVLTTEMETGVMLFKEKGKRGKTKKERGGDQPSSFALISKDAKQGWKVKCI